ncbi:MAG: tetratricopeptide repeat protein, partial [Phycisphaerae bacterium]|nr:tetratricopeptide repeat protein [Phycisphaerae bacterium]
QSLAIRRNTSGDSSPDVWNGLTNLASLLEASDQLALAEQTRREALALARAIFDERHRNVVISLGGLARVLWLRGGGSLEEAERLANSALELARVVEGPQSPSYARRLDLLANIARDRGRLDQAIELHRDTLALRRAILKPDNPEIAASQTNLADVLSRAAKSPAEAVELASAALAARKASLPEGHASIWVSTSVLGGACTAAGQFDKAESLLLEAFAGLSKDPGVPRRLRAEAAERVLRLYEKWGKMEEAGRWKNTLIELSQPSPTP